MKTLRILLVIAISLFALGLTQSDAKAGEFAYTSSINVQNLDNVAASIQINFYKQDGIIDTTVSDSISALGSKSYFPIQASVGFNGSVIITSTSQVAAISNILGDNGAAAAAYVAANSGSTTVLVPLLMKGNGGYNTWFNVQNTGSLEATVNITYSDGTSITNQKIPPGAAKTFDQSTETHSAKVFSAIITSDQPVAATVIEENPDVMFAYSGFTQAQAVTNPVIPLVNANNAGYHTGITLQNSGGTDTTVTLSYTPSGPGNGTACTETQSITAGKNATFAFSSFQGSPQPGMSTTCAAGQKFVGSAKVTSNTASQNLVGIINQLKSGVNGEAYGSFDAASATGEVVLPLIMNANGGYFTSINVQNVSSSSTTVTCNFTGSSVTASQALDAGEGVSFLQPDQFGSSKYVGSATCTASGSGKIVAVVNELGSSSSADQLLVYEGISLP